MLLRTKIGNFDDILDTFYPPYRIPIYGGKKRRHVMEIIMVLSMMGKSTTHEIAEHALSIDTNFKAVHEIPYRDIRSKAGIYYKLINDRTEYIKKLNEEKKYDGLITQGYVIQTGTKINKKRKKIPLYSLTLQGCFVALGFKHVKLKSLIDIASRNHLFFRFLETIIELTSYSFVNELFIKSIRNDIEKGRISFENEKIHYYFNQLAEIIGLTLIDMFRKSLQKYNNYDGKIKYADYPGISDIETLIHNTYYYEQPKSDWEDSLIEKYYSEPDEEIFYRDYCDYEIEQHLVFRVMRNIHFNYYFTLGIFPIPRKPQNKLLRSKQWKEHRRFKRKPQAWITPKQKIKKKSKKSK